MENQGATLALGTKPVGQLLMQYALPAIVAMTASSLYNIIDRAFIGQLVGPEAIAGLGITFPFMNYKTAQYLLGNTVTLNLIVGVLFMIVCLLFLDPILRFFGASDVTLPYAREFMVVILLGNVVTHMYFGMNAVLRAAGKPRVCHPVHRRYEHSVGDSLCVVVPLGHPRGSFGYHFFPDDGALLADVDTLRQERVAASAQRNL